MPDSQPFSEGSSEEEVSSPFEEASTSEELSTLGSSEEERVPTCEGVSTSEEVSTCEDKWSISSGAVTVELWRIE